MSRLDFSYPGLDGFGGNLLSRQHDGLDGSSPDSITDESSVSSSPLRLQFPQPFYCRASFMVNGPMRDLLRLSQTSIGKSQD
ncbi:Uncharacterized protein HZ326_24008 [Fusarium oxysporum f. sp. albedinis]|nr:Uncharacterized protein HZ326_24008 [Fusarium oxysporum f. sp. albedinis]